VVGDELESCLVPRRTFVTSRRAHSHALLSTGIAQPVVQLAPAAVLLLSDLRQHGAHRIGRGGAHVGLTLVVGREAVGHLLPRRLQARAQKVGGGGPCDRLLWGGGPCRLERLCWEATDQASCDLEHHELDVPRLVGGQPSEPRLRRGRSVGARDVAKDAHVIAHELQCRLVPRVAPVVAGGTVRNEGGCVWVVYLVVQRGPAEGVVVELVPPVRAWHLVRGHLGGGSLLAECDHRDLLWQPRAAP